PHSHTPSSFLFFPSSPPLRVLPSFPTRRSSDLAAGTHGRVSERRHLRVPRGSAAALLLHRSERTHPGRASSDRAGNGPGPGPRTDRKSTRLNSSHVAISYAVFCLKKKKQKKIKT